MDTISSDPAVQAASAVLSWTEINERQCLADLAREVPDGGLIVDIGVLYGGVTAVLALAQPKARIHSIDNFSWQPEGYPMPSALMFMDNMGSLGIANVVCQIGDSRDIGKQWALPIDLLWVDGGHSYEYVYADLENFGPSARVVALHDYGNPAWESVNKAVGDFLSGHPEYVLDKVVGTVAVLRRDH